MPLYHFVTRDLPEDTRAPELDDTNTSTALKLDLECNGNFTTYCSEIKEPLIGKYLRYLVDVEFLSPPTDKQAKPLPASTLSNEQRENLAKLAGRGKLV